MIFVFQISLWILLPKVVRLIDFDLACNLIQDGRFNAPVSDCSPPEKLVTSTYDVWGLGVMMVRLCCAKVTQNALQQLYSKLQQDKKDGDCLREFHNNINFDRTRTFFDPDAMKKLIQGCVNLVDRRFDLDRLQKEVSEWPQH